jgi:hypothetical protein
MNYDRKATSYKSPDLSKLQEVIIDFKTKIYIAVGADPEEAKLRYFAKLDLKKK